ncbi:hypothetical protein Sjap_020349 [Stephania japonica]|uniref:Uncharacterized protein n=1 Tax=Stephania japonica TaxID=461633 RepID=A0AAP0I0D3_9MAGN
MAGVDRWCLAGVIASWLKGLKGVSIEHKPTRVSLSLKLNKYRSRMPLLR